MGMGAAPGADKERCFGLGWAGFGGGERIGDCERGDFLGKLRCASGSRVGGSGEREFDLLAGTNARIIRRKNDGLDVEGDARLDAYIQLMSYICQKSLTQALNWSQMELVAPDYLFLDSIVLADQDSEAMAATNHPKERAAHPQYGVRRPEVGDGAT